MISFFFCPDFKPLKKFKNSINEIVSGSADVNKGNNSIILFEVWVGSGGDLLISSRLIKPAMFDSTLVPRVIIFFFYLTTLSILWSSSPVCSRPHTICIFVD